MQQWYVVVVVVVVVAAVVVVVVVVVVVAAVVVVVIVVVAVAEVAEVRRSSSNAELRLRDSVQGEEVKVNFAELLRCCSCLNLTLVVLSLKLPTCQ